MTRPSSPRASQAGATERQPGRPKGWPTFWFPEKLLAAFAEGAASVTALAGAIVTGLAAKARP